MGRRDFFLLVDARAFFRAIRKEKIWGELWKIDAYGDADELLDEFGNRGIEE